MRIAARKILPPALMALGLLVAYQAVATGTVFIPGDTYFSVFPLMSAVSSALKNLELPLWMPFVRRGVPLSDLLGLPIWSPLTFVLAAIGYSLELINVQFLIVAALGAAFMYLALERFVADDWVRAAGALAYATSGLYVGNAQHITFITAASLLPLFHFAAFRWLASGRCRDAVWVGMALALLVLNGYPPFVVLVVLFVGVEAALCGEIGRMWRESPIRRWVSGIGVIAATSLLLSLVAVVTTLQVSSRTVRAASIPWADVANNGMHPVNWAAVIAPSLVEIIPRWTYFLEPSMRNTYLAAPLVLFCLVSPMALWGSMSARRLLGLVFMASCAVLITLGDATPLYKTVLYEHVPLMNLYRFPAGLRFFAFFYIVALGAMCAQRMIRAGGVGRVFDLMKALCLAGLAGAVVLLVPADAGVTPFVEAGVGMALLMLLVIWLEKRWRGPGLAVFLCVAMFSTYATWRNPDHGLGSRGRPTGYDAELAAMYRNSAWEVPNAFVEPTVFGAFNVFLRRFETAGYIGTLELTSYHDARRLNALPKPGEPVVSVVSVGDAAMDAGRLVTKARDAASSPAPASISVHVNEIRAVVDSAQAGYVLLQQNNYPGWTVSVDGVRRRVIPTSEGAMAVLVDPGRHEVHFTFRPLKIIVPFWITACAWLVALCMGVFALGSRLLLRRALRRGAGRNGLGDART